MGMIALKLNTAPPRPAATDRHALHRLDACLHLLEDANERGEQRVSPSLAHRLHPHLRWVAAGMPLGEAIERVFAEQERFLRGEGLELLPAATATDWRQTPPDEPVDQAQARALTDQIKAGMRQVCMLLLEAHRRRAWLALGYDSWERYVREEFSLSKSRSYELLDQAHVLRSIQLALGMPEVPRVSAYAAGEIKHLLAEVIDEVRLRAEADGAQPRVTEIVTEVVQVTRKRIAAVREYAGPAPSARPRPAPAGGVSATPLDLPQPIAWYPPRLDEAIALLAALPSPALVLGQLSADGGERLPGLDRALGWLTEFARHYHARPSITQVS
jgi:hypothetical protein